MTYSFLWMRADGAQLAEIAAVVLRPVVGRVYPFADTPAALTALIAGGFRGKLVIDLDG